MNARMLIDNKDGSAYAEIFNSSGESILVVNKAGVILLANPKSEKLFGFKNGELPGHQIEKLMPERFHMNHSVQRGDYVKRPTSRRMGTGRDLVAIKKSGEEFPIEVSLNPAVISEEQVIIAFVIDITARKRIEKELESSEKRLIKYAAELERRVNDRTIELEQVISELEESNVQLEKEIREREKAEQEAKKSLQRERELSELKSRFVSMASHEFRTPLSTILSSAGLIAKYSELGEVQKEVKHIERIKSNVYDLTSILNDFLSLDKLEAGKTQNHPQIIEAVAFIGEVREELELMTKKGQTILFTSELKTCNLYIDRHILKHIMMNLLSNAIKYSSENTSIRILLKEIESHTVIEVRDEGIGIPKEDQKHLFERFFRAHNATNIQGTGLGLNLVKKYLDLLGGRIQYETNEGQGSTFIVHIPKSESP